MVSKLPKKAHVRYYVIAGIVLAFILVVSFATGAMSGLAFHKPSPTPGPIPTLTPTATPPYTTPILTPIRTPISTITPAPTPPPSAAIPKYGVVVQEDEYPECASALSDLRQAGSYWIRGDCVTPSEVASFWSAMNSQGIEVLGVLNQACLQLGEVGPTWQAYVQSIVDAAPNVPAWEIGNEPEQTYNITPQTYMTYLEEAYTIIKAADPHALIIGPAVGCSSTGAQYLSTIKSLGAFNYLDAISAHYYPYSGFSDIQDIESVVAGAKPIWITETGYPSDTSGGEAAQNSYVQTYLNSTSGTIGSDPAIKVIIYYDLNNADDSWGLNNGPPSYTPKEAYATFKSFVESTAPVT